MSNIDYDEINNLTTVEITDPSTYNCLKMYRDTGNVQNLYRTEEAHSLADTIINGTKHSQVVVKFGDSFLPLPSR